MEFFHTQLYAYDAIDDDTWVMSWFCGNGVADKYE